MPNQTKHSLLPREKLQLLKNPASLHDYELLALILRTGTAKKNAVQLAHSLLSYQPLTQIAHLELDDLLKIPGIGTAKACSLLAALQLANRIQQHYHCSFNNPTTVASFLQSLMPQRQEHLIGLYLDGRHRLLAQELLGKGSLNSLEIHPREVFAPALEHRAATIILAHNHPSGDPNPSLEDIAAHDQLCEVGTLLGIPIIDHVIIAKQGWYSLRAGTGSQELTTSTAPQPQPVSPPTDSWYQSKTTSRAYLQTTRSSTAPA